MRRISQFLASLVLIVSSVLVLPLLTSAAGGGSLCQPDGIPKAYAFIADRTAAAPHTTQIEGTYSEGCGDAIVDYQWDFGDGTTGNGRVVEHTFGAGTWTVTLTVTDEAGLSDTDTSSFEVRASNAVPIAGDDEFTFPNYGDPTPWTFALNGNDYDADGDHLTYGLVTPAEHGQVSVSNGYFYYVAEPGYYGADRFTYKVSDYYGGESLTATVNLTLQSPNNPPVASNDSKTTNEDAPTVINVLANDSDPEGDLLTVAIVGSAENTGSFTVNADQTVSYTPATNFNGQSWFDYSVSDGHGGQASARAYITVTAVNDAPVATNDNVTTNEDQPVSFNVLSNDTDVDGALANTAILSGPTHGTLTTLDNGSYRYTPSANYNGADTFSYRVTDSGSLASEAQVSLNITSVNDNPTAQFSHSISKPKTVYFTNQSSDADNHILSYSWSFGDSISSTAVHPSHTYARKGTYTVTLQVTDNTGSVVTVTKVLAL